MGQNEKADGYALPEPPPRQDRVSSNILRINFDMDGGDRLTMYTTDEDAAMRCKPGACGCASGPPTPYRRRVYRLRLEVPLIHHWAFARGNHGGKSLVTVENGRTETITLSDAAAQYCNHVELIADRRFDAEPPPNPLDVLLRGGIGVMHGQPIPLGSFTLGPDGQIVPDGPQPPAAPRPASEGDRYVGRTVDEVMADELKPGPGRDSAERTGLGARFDG
jgi:hypothetical protein